jgi:ATP/maltotriose-dependent transcriptional regulator MalT
VAREALERARTVLAEAPTTTPLATPLATLRASLGALEIFVSLRLGDPPADLDARLAADPGLPTGLAVALAVGAGLAAERADDLSLALTRLDHAARLALATTSALPSGITAVAHRVRVLRRLGQLDEARRAADEGLAAIERHGWSAWPVAAELTLELAMVDLDEGQLAAAEARAIASLHALRLGDDPTVVARGLLGLAMIRRARGDHAGAKDAAAQAEAMARDAGIPWLAAAAHSLLEPTATPEPAPPKPEPSSHEADLLSARELEVLALVAQGLSNQVVGRRLFIAPVTVKTHVHNILTKLQARSRTEAVHRARSRGLLS